MFTGLVQHLGEIKQVRPSGGGLEIEVFCPEIAKEVKPDDSVAINGVCQTVTHCNESTFRVFAIQVTLTKTNLGQLQSRKKVNLELALRPMDRLGGHFVQGHVGGLGKLIKLEVDQKNRHLYFSFPPQLRKYFILEGSIAIDGISLTIADLSNDYLMVSIIPHTMENTNLQFIKCGDQVNLEVDMLAKYMENFLRPFLSRAQQKPTLTDLQEMGY